MDIQPAAEPIDLTPAADLTPEPSGAEETGSLDEHEAQFKARSPIAKPEPEALSKDELEAVDKVGKQARYRANSQKATPDDVQAINAATKELRALEAELVKVKPDAIGDESPRVRVLKRQIAAVKADLDAAKPKDSEPVKPTPVAARSEATSTDFTDAEPQPDTFKDEADPLGAYLKAWNRWDRKRERFEEGQVAAKESADASTKAFQAEANKRIDAFVASHPDFDAKAQSLLAMTLPNVLVHAIGHHDKSPEVMYHLAQHPELVDELVLLTDGKPLSELSVAAVQRRLSTLVSGATAATTGSAVPPAKPFNPPKPPNPVRTGPNRSGDELPDEDASLTEHEKAFHRKRRP